MRYFIANLYKVLVCAVIYRVATKPSIHFLFLIQLNFIIGVFMRQINVLNMELPINFDTILVSYHTLLYSAQAWCGCAIIQLKKT